MANYEEALAALRALVDDLEADRVPLEELATRLEEAESLLAFCQNHLRQISDKIESFDTQA